MRCELMAGSVINIPGFVQLESSWLNRGERAVSESERPCDRAESVQLTGSEMHGLYKLLIQSVCVWIVSTEGDLCLYKLVRADGKLNLVLSDAMWITSLLSHDLRGREAVSVRPWVGCSCTTTSSSWEQLVSTGCFGVSFSGWSHMTPHCSSLSWGLNIKEVELLSDPKIKLYLKPSFSALFWKALWGLKQSVLILLLWIHWPVKSSMYLFEF